GSWSSGNPATARAAPMRAGPEPVRREPERPDTGNAWGRSETLSPYQSAATFVRFESEHCEPLTLSASVPQPPLTATYQGTNGPLPLPLAIFLVVTFGNGSTTVQRAWRVDDYLPGVPLLATYCQVP